MDTMTNNTRPSSLIATLALFFFAAAVLFITLAVHSHRGTMTLPSRHSLHDRRLLSTTTPSLGRDHHHRRLYSNQVLPRLADADMVELFHLRSYPTQLIDSSVGFFLVQTSGIALRSTSTKQLVVLEYRPANYSACFLPVVNLRPNNQSTLYWDKRSVLSYRTELDKKYWQQSTFLGRINGVVYENYVKWVEEYISRDKVFVPQSICSSAEEISCFVRAETWETFLTDSLETFASLMVQMNAIIPPRAKEMHLLSNTEPVRFALSDAGTDANYSSPGDGGIAKDTGVGSLTADEPNYGGGGRDSNDRFDAGTAPGSGSGRDERLRRRFLKRNTTEGLATAWGVGSRENNSEATNNAGASVGNVNSTSSSSSSSVAVASVVTNSTDTGGSATDVANNSSIASSVTGSAKAEEMATAVNVTESEMAEYYASLMVCMQEYTMEDFTSALGSCLTERIGYIHIDGGQYYRISPRFPFALMQEYLQPIPSARLAEVESAGFSDFLISFMLLLSALLGLLATLWRLNLFDYCWAKLRRVKRRRRVGGASAPAEGGYSSASELPVYKSWGVGDNDKDSQSFSSSSLVTPSHGHIHGRGINRSSVAFFNPSPFAPASFLSPPSAGKIARSSSMKGAAKSPKMKAASPLNVTANEKEIGRGRTEDVEEEEDGEGEINEEARAHEDEDEDENQSDEGEEVEEEEEEEHLPQTERYYTSILNLDYAPETRRLLP